MRVFKLALPVGVLLAGFVFCTTASFGKPEYAAKEKAKCLDCHSAMGAKDVMAKNLNDTGKCYASNDHKDLAKCKK